MCIIKNHDKKSVPNLLNLRIRWKCVLSNMLLAISVYASTYLTYFLLRMV